jgi:hypothetical protein
VKEFDELKTHRLPNWGAWGRQDSDRPDPEACGRSPAADYNASKDSEAGWGDEDAAPEAPPDPIDWRDAEHLDGFIRQLPAAHREVIRAVFYKRRDAHWSRIDAAVRALIDSMGENRRVVAKMRSLGG